VHPNAERVQTALRERGCAAEVIQTPDSTRTAAEAAAALGTGVAQIVKSLVFVVHDQPAGIEPSPTGTPLLVLASGINRVSTEKLRAIVGAKVTRPDADAVRRLTGYAIGGIPPLAHDTPARVLMDPHLLDYDMVWAAAGTPHAVFGLPPAELQRITAAEVRDVVEPSRA
jgi:prolyl-tRNA editing enzyme YbaK/EbsC (Cys-tRNA(Pro) deacylase)